MERRVVVVLALVAGLAGFFLIQQEEMRAMGMIGGCDEFPEGWVTAVVERIEDGRLAVLEISLPGGPDEERELMEREMIVPLDKLPKRAREGTWLRVLFVDGLVADSRVDADATRAAAERIEAKLERLRQRR